MGGRVGSAGARERNCLEVEGELGSVNGRKGRRTAVTSPAYKGAIGGVFWPTLPLKLCPNSRVATKALSIFRRR